MERSQHKFSAYANRIWVFAILLAFWFSFTGVSLPEVALGLPSAVLATWFIAVVRSAGLASFRPKVTWLTQAWQLPGALLRGYWVLAVALAEVIFGKRRSSGLFRVVGFEGGGEDGVSASRRATAIAMGTLPPNFVVVGIQRKLNRMMVHQVHADDVPDYMKALGAK
jgi:hypothetical protein